MSKQQGLLHSPRSEDGGSIRYRALTDQDPSPPASTTGAIGVGGTCALFFGSMNLAVIMSRYFLFQKSLEAHTVDVKRQIPEMDFRQFYAMPPTAVV